MAATSRRDSSSRGSSRASASRSNGNSRGRGSQAASRGRSGAAQNAGTRSRKTAGGNRAGGNRAKAQNGNRAKGQNGKAASQSRSSNGSSVRETLTHVGIPAATGALGVAGGLLLGRTALQRNPKILGVRVPRVSIDMTNLGRQIGDAGRQFARLAHEVETAREPAEKGGRAMS